MTLSLLHSLSRRSLRFHAFLSARSISRRAESACLHRPDRRWLQKEDHKRFDGEICASIILVPYADDRRDEVLAGARRRRFKAGLYPLTFAT